MAKDEKTLVVPDAKSGQPVKVTIVASHSVTKEKKVLIVKKKEGKEKPLIIQTPKNGIDPAYIWGCNEKRFSDEEIIPLLLFFKKNDMENYVNGFEIRIRKILEGVLNENKKCIKIIRKPETVNAISELYDIFHVAALELYCPLCQKLRNLQLENVIAAMYMEKGKS